MTRVKNNNKSIVRNCSCNNTMRVVRNEQTLRIEGTTSEIKFKISPDLKDLDITVKVTTPEIELPANSTAEVLQAVGDYRARVIQQDHEDIAWMARGVAKAYQAYKGELLTLLGEMPSIIETVAGLKRSVDSFDDEFRETEHVRDEERRTRREAEAEKDSAERISELKRSYDEDIQKERLRKEHRQALADLEQEFEPVQ